MSGKKMAVVRTTIGSPSLLRYVLFPDPYGCVGARKVAYRIPTILVTMLYIDV